MNISQKKIVFVGVARDVEPFIRQVLRNIEACASQFADWSIILLENDSRDGTKQLLQKWVSATNAKNAGRAKLIELDGIEWHHPKRTDRLAAARNLYLKEIADSGLKDFDYLAVTDMDDANVSPIALENIRAAVDFLECHDDVAAVFPNQFPVYYDIWALRKPGWCPDDCWDEVEAEKVLIGKDAAEKKYVFDRQHFIDSTHEPIEVESAFGGIGIYKMPLTPGLSYVGLNADDTEVCEHVAFHRMLRESGKKLFILPDFLNITSLKHTNLLATHTAVPVAANGKTVKLLASKENHFTKFRAQYPLYAERFAILAACYARRRQGSILELGADFGAGLALSRLYGCDSEYICVEQRTTNFMILSANALVQRELFGRFRRRSEFTTLAELDDGHIGLIKLDTEDAGEILARDIPFLTERQPVLWAKAAVRSPEPLATWTQMLAAFSGIYRYVLLFDNMGVAVAAGALTETQDMLVTFLAQQIEHNHAPDSPHGRSPSLVFFAADDGDLYEDFRPLLRELKSP